MKRHFIDSEYSLPGAEFTRPPEQPETLLDKRKYPGGLGAPPEPRTEAKDPLNPTIEAAEAAAETTRAADSAQTAERKSKKKRSLLLQMAAVASSVVLVTNSFGLDLLGLDGLFNDSVILGQVAQETQPVPAETEEPKDSIWDYRQKLPLGGEASLPSPGQDVGDRPGETFVHDHYIAAVDYAREEEARYKAELNNFIYVDPENEGDIGAPHAVSWLHWTKSQLEERTEEENLSYDAASNTLTLRNYRGKGLLVHRMGQDFTIRLEGENVLEQFLTVGGGSLTLSGSGSLIINPDENDEYEYGIFLSGGFTDACLRIERDVHFDISGAYSVFGFEATSTQKAVRYVSGEPWPGVYQAQKKESVSSGLPGDAARYYSWWIVGEGDRTTITRLDTGGTAVVVPITEAVTEPAGPGTEPATEPVTEPVTETEPVVQGLPVGGDSAFPILPNPLPGSQGADGVVYPSGIEFWETASSSTQVLYALGGRDQETVTRNDISYDANSNTLTLNNCIGYKLYIYNMGNSFTVRLIGKNEFDDGIVVSGDYTGGSIRFTGDGYLLLESSGWNGLVLESSFSESCVMIDSSVTMDINGAESSVRVFTTSAAKAIYYLSDEPIAGLYQTVFLTEADSSGAFAGTYQSWNTVDEDGQPVTHIHIGGEVPPDPEYPGLPVGGDSEFPELPNLWPNTPLPGSFFDTEDEYVTLNEDYIQLFDRDTSNWENYLYLNPAWDVSTVSPEGISYDRTTNTLTLNNYHGKGISANLLGNGFTVELIGENELTQDFMVWGFYTGGSIRFTGTGSLTINSSQTQEVGLALICEYSESVVMIDPGVTLDIYGTTNALQVIWTNAEKGIYLLSGAPLRNMRQVAVGEDTAQIPGSEEQTYCVWVLTDNQGTELTHVTIHTDVP